MYGYRTTPNIRFAWSMQGASSSAQSVMPAHPGASKNFFGGTYRVLE
jgi:hypothetical protein